jgi:hypothetical protein
VHKNTARSTEVFDRFGLSATGFWGSLALPPEPGKVHPPPERLREAFEELSGLYGSFAQFLCWRADLLGAEYLAQIRLVKVETPGIPREEFTELLIRELGAAEALPLIRGLDDEPAWATLQRTAFRTWQRGRRVVIETANPVVSETQVTEFTEGVKALGHVDLERATAPQAMGQFVQWLRQSESLKQERRYLEELSRRRTETLVDYPALIDELTTENLLAWEWLDGDPVSRLVRTGSSDVVTKIAAAVLEQYFSLAIIDAALDLDQMGLQRNGRIVMWRVNRAMAVPPPQINVGMKYVAAVLLGESAAIVQTLVPMATGRPSEVQEKKLMNLLSAVEPELKVHLWFPTTAAAFESNWMALSRLVQKRPLYLDSLHRNLEAVGYWNAGAVKAGGPMTDAIADGHAAVVGRVLRTQVRLLVNRKAAGEWVTGAGLIMFGVLRALNRVAEELRENNLTMGVGAPETGGGERPASRTGRRGVVIGVLLATLLISLRWGAGSEGPGAWVARFLALVAAAGLFWVVGRVS